MGPNAGLVGMPGFVHGAQPPPGEEESAWFLVDDSLPSLSRARSDSCIVFHLQILGSQLSPTELSDAVIVRLTSGSCGPFELLVEVGD